MPGANADPTPSDPRDPSRTAVFVAQGRAVADGRWAIGRFSDPVSARLLRGSEIRRVEQVRAGERPSDGTERMAVESVRAVAEVMTPRTVAIDDAVRDAGHDQVVLLGAGLDTRPWRMHELADAIVYAVDHRATQADAVDRAADLTPVVGRLVLVPADLGRDELDAALSAAGHDATRPTTWVWEGVVPYLSPAEVAATADALARRSAAGSVLVANYQARSLVVVMGRRVSGLLARVTGVESPLAGEPWRSLWTPSNFRELLMERGFVVEGDEDLLAVAEAIGSPTTHARSLGNGRVARACVP